MVDQDALYLGIFIHFSERVSYRENLRFFDFSKIKLSLNMIQSSMCILYEEVSRSLLESLPGGAPNASSRNGLDTYVLVCKAICISLRLYAARLPATRSPSLLAASSVARDRGTATGTGTGWVGQGL